MTTWNSDGFSTLGANEYLRHIPHATPADRSPIESALASFVGLEKVTPEGAVRLFVDVAVSLLLGANPISTSAVAMLND
jgi:hypothetical protein